MATNEAPKCVNEPVAIAIYAKAPRPGTVKTRLIPMLGAAGAAALQADLIARTVAQAVAANTGPVSLWCAPDMDHPLFAELASRFNLSLHCQCAGDLGARMADTFATITRDIPALLFGSDCAVLEADHLSPARKIARRNDAVFLPVEDGGYVLVGLRKPAPALFDDIAEHGQCHGTNAPAAAALGLRINEGPVLWDIDRPQDVERARRKA